jgi:type IV pilus biogenesis protein PilP
MTTASANYAVDLSNDGVELWHRDKDHPWQLLGKVKLSAHGFSQTIEKLKAVHGPNGDKKFIAQVRIPPSEIFASRIDLSSTADPDIAPKVYDFLAQNTPYAAQDLIYDLENRDDADIAYVAAITKQTLDEAKKFIADCGFDAAFYTSNLDKETFPRHPRFFDDDRSSPIPAPIADAADTLAEKPAASKISTPAPPVKPTSATTPDTIIKTKPADTSKTKLADMSKPKEAGTKVKAKVEGPQDEGKETDLNTFGTIRGKPLAAKDKASQKTDPVTDKSSAAPPPPRISIGPPRPKTKTPLTTSAVPPIKTPQGDVAKSGIIGTFKLRYTVYAAVIGLLALMFWFYATLFDGKEEIRLLQQIPATEPFIIAEPQLLKHQISSDSIATPEFGITGRAFPDPRFETPETLNEPAQVSGVENIDRNAPGQKAKNTLAPTPDTITAAQEKPAEISQTASTDPAAALEIPENTRQDTTETAVALLEPDPDIETSSADTIAPVKTEIAPQEEEPDLLALADPALKTTPPKPRPPSIAAIAGDLKNSLMALADPSLATPKPKRRPATLSVPKDAKIDPLEIEIAVQQAVNETARARLRPKSLSKTVAKANANAEATQTSALITSLSPDAARGTSKASSPSPVNIQKEATEKTRFNKKRMSLIGVFGKPSARQALLRMPSGRFVKVKPGQKISGWKVAAIGESSVRITKGSRNQVLRMPKR